MSEIKRCPVCETVTSHQGLGNLVHEGQVRNVKRCMTCKGLWEEVVTRKPIKKNDPIRKMLV